MTHKLKTWREFFVLVLSGVKKFEVRLNDRDYRVGDELLLQEWDPKANEYTGRNLSRVVTYILEGGQFGIEPEYVVLGIKKI